MFYLFSIVITFGSNKSQDSVWVACFNTIMLHTLSVRTCKEIRTDTVLQNALDDNMLVSFLDNAQCSHSSLQRLLEPRLVNIQALLCMVTISACLSISSLAALC